MSALPFDIVETNRLTTFYQLVQLDTFHNLINVYLLFTQAKTRLFILLESYK